MTDHQHTADVLNRAADLIEERGWTQGPDGWLATGPVCAMGSLGAAIGTRLIGGNYCAWEVAEHPAAGTVADYLGEGVYCWNDHPDRTASEVIEVLRAAAAIEQGRADAVDTAAAQKSRMIAIADDAAARTLARLR